MPALMRHFAALILSMMVSMILGMSSGCGKGFNSPIPHPPSTPFDPGNDTQGEGYGSGSGGQGGAGGTGGGSGGPVLPPGPPQCEIALRRCPQTFSYAGATALPLTGQEKSVTLIGDYRSDSWGNGDPLNFDGTKWVVSIGVPWATQVHYKFHIVYQNSVSNPDKYVADPNNPYTVPDGFGGVNSVLLGMTCAQWTCQSTQIQCAGAPLGAQSFDWRDALIYWAFIDRFVNGDPGNDMPATAPNLDFATNWQGGDWAGLISKIDSGYFKSLGVNTLWISVPVLQSQAIDPGTNGDNNLYSAYHAYWPHDLTQTEPHFGTSALLKTLVTTAHSAGIKVLIDYAMHHVHTDSPIYNDPTHAGWFTPLQLPSGQPCVCGSQQCSYDGATATLCWFAPYLATFDFTNAAARQFSVANALSWIENYGFDGFRLDAIKQIQTSWLTDFRAALLSNVETKTGQHVYLVGETFSTKPALIKQYVAPCSQLDGQFDFPLRAQIISTLLLRKGAMSDLINFMNANTGYYGTSVMSTFIGNHDVPRAIHFAEDSPLWTDPWADGKDRNWSNQPSQPTTTNAYDRLAVAFALIMTNVGAPLIYYGDEVGLAGAGDPDNRRMMKWGSGAAGDPAYLDGQKQLFAKVQQLGALRAAHPALRRGDRATLFSSADAWVYSMSDGSDRVYVALNRGDAMATVNGLPAQSLTDQMTGAQLMGPMVMVPPRSVRVLTSP
jgi:glycosidase